MTKQQADAFFRRFVVLGTRGRHRDELQVSESRYVKLCRDAERALTHELERVRSEQ